MRKIQVVAHTAIGIPAAGMAVPDIGFFALCAGGNAGLNVSFGRVPAASLRAAVIGAMLAFAAGLIRPAPRKDPS